MAATNKANAGVSYWQGKDPKSVTGFSEMASDSQ